MFKFILILALVYLPNLSWAKKGDINDPFIIVQVIPDLPTHIEKGFENYLNLRRIATKITQYSLRDYQQNPSNLVNIIKSLNPDFVYTNGAEATKLIFGTISDYKNQSDKFITNIPGIFVNLPYSVEYGIIASYLSSERNIVGISNFAPIDLQLSSLFDFKKFTKVGVVYNPNDPISVFNKTELITKLRQQNINFHEAKIGQDINGKPSLFSMEQIFEELKINNVDVIYLGTDKFIIDNQAKFTHFATLQKIPVFSTYETPLLEGKALFGIVSNLTGIGKSAGKLTEDILFRQIPPQSIKFYNPSEYFATLNIKAVKALNEYPSYTQLKQFKIVGYLP